MGKRDLICDITITITINILLFFLLIFFFIFFSYIFIFLSSIIPRTSSPVQDPGGPTRVAHACAYLRDNGLYTLVDFRHLPVSACTPTCFGAPSFLSAGQSIHMYGSHVGNPSRPAWNLTTCCCGCLSLLPRSFLTSPCRSAVDTLHPEICGGPSLSERVSPALVLYHWFFSQLFIFI